MLKTALFSVLILSFVSCVNNEKSAPQVGKNATKHSTYTLEGDLYFQHETEYNPEYLHLNISQGKISGEAYTENALSGGVAVPLSGKILSGDSLSLVVYDTEETEPEEIILHYSYDGATLHFEGPISWALSAEYQKITKSEMPDAHEYGTVEEMEFEMVGEYIENVFPETYQSVMPDPMKHWGGLHEYFTILHVLDTVVGHGFGESDGEPSWEFHFSGLVEDDSIYHVNVCYHQEGYPDIDIQETWTLHRHSGDFILKGYNRPEEGRRYVWASEDDLNEPVREGLKKAQKSADAYNKGEMYYQRNKTLQSVDSSR